ncbi:MAG: 4Fe-4S dicluster domain-containing protein [Desulfobacteraceae bacterium]|nr:4Fe-4S dicluster domain-containing protein [Desulfobacteraceae bacterium]
MSTLLSRRAFLRGGVAAAGTVAASPVAKALPQDNTSEQLATLIDIQRCIGCESCVEACRDSNQTKFPNPAKPFPKMYPNRVPVEDWSEKQDVMDRLTPYNWLFIQSAYVDVNGEETELSIPRRCMHCTNPPCVKLCPWGAAQQLDNGISRIDADLCLGGSKCKNVCPWQIPQRQTGTGLYLDLLPSLAGNGVMYKCDRCHDRIAEGELPACIDACPEDVQTIGPRDEIIAEAHRIAADIDGYIYGEHENGGTNTIYVSPVPFEEINRAMEGGKGIPHLGAATNRMEAAENLALAMVIAPFAGLAAAAGKIVKHFKSGIDQGDANETK